MNAIVIESRERRIKESSGDRNLKGRGTVKIRVSDGRLHKFIWASGLKIY